MVQTLLYVLYGLVDGFSNFTPVSASAHQAMFGMMLKFDGYDPLLRMFTHAGALGAVLLLYRKQLEHLRTQMRLMALPPKRRKRPVDADAVMDARLVLTAAIPALVGALISGFSSLFTVRLLPLMLLLTASGIAAFLPAYLPGGDRKARLMSPMEGFLLGICAGAAVLPGISAVGLMLALARIRKCDKRYMIDIIMLIVAVMLGGSVVVDLARWLISGLSGCSLRHLLGCILAAAAALGGGAGAILTMRFLAVNSEFSGFAFYNWGLGLFCFMLYLVL